MAEDKKVKRGDWVMFYKYRFHGAKAVIGEVQEIKGNAVYTTVLATYYQIAYWHWLHFLTR